MMDGMACKARKGGRGTGGTRRRDLEKKRYFSEKESLSI